MVQHFLSLNDLGTAGLLDVLARAHKLKKARRQGELSNSLRGKSIGLLFEKASTRTRISFEVGIVELGGYPVTLGGQHLQIGRGESLEDTARVFERYLSALVYRTSGHERLQTFASRSSISIINGLSDLYHPCQLLADLLTVQEAKGNDFSKLCVAWVGDGNNMAHSWMMAAGLLGFELRLAVPPGYDPAVEAIQTLQTLPHSARVSVLRKPAEAVENADIVTTDVWASMGQEQETAARQKAFADFCVTKTLMAQAKHDAVFLHCLPAHRGEEVEAPVIDGPQSLVWDEAENRLHAQKALLEYLLT